MPTPNHPDLAILLAARDGDHEAGRRLVLEHAASMVRTAWSVLGRYGGAEAEDVVQESLVAALTTPALPTEDIGAWLRAITARKALDWLRRSTRRAEQPFPESADASPEPIEPSSSEAPLAVLTVRRALARLTPLDRAVLTLVDLEGFSMAEAAKAIGSTTVAVKWRAVRARRKLGALLGFDAGEGATRRRTDG